MQTDGLGYTEREWENMWSERSQDDGCQTSHVSSLDDEGYCEGCDQAVDYSDGNKHGCCGCDEIEGPEPDGYRQTLGGPGVHTSR
jgi:hypothetical protein